MTPTILLVEDNPITSKLVRFTLENVNYVVVDACRWRRGGRAVSRASPHALVLLDLLLPDIDGFDLLHKLRALPSGRDVPILAFSGMLSAADEARLSEVGFDDVVTKPIEPSRLLQIVRGHLPPSEPLPVQPARDPAVAAKVLVLADDDAVQRKMVALRLQRAGFKVVTMAADGHEALQRAREIKPFAIVSDVLMPRLDGYGLCMAVRNDPMLATRRSCSISNSYLDAEDKQLARRAGADEMLVRTPELLDVIALLQGDLRRRGSHDRASTAPVTARSRARARADPSHDESARAPGRAPRGTQSAVLVAVGRTVGVERHLRGRRDPARSRGCTAPDPRVVLRCRRDLARHVVPDQRSRPARACGSVCSSWSPTDISSFFGHRELLESAIAAQALVCIPSDAHPEARRASSSSGRARAR